MAIKVSELLDLMSMKTNASGPAFFSAFYHSINSVIRDINRMTAWQVPTIDPSNPPAEINADERLFNVFDLGVAYYMSQASPKWSRLSDDKLYGRYYEELALAQTLAFREGMIPVGWEYTVNDEE